MSDEIEETTYTEPEYYFNDWIRATCWVIIACVLAFMAWQAWLLLVWLWLGFLVFLNYAVVYGVGFLLVCFIFSIISSMVQEKPADKRAEAARREWEYMEGSAYMAQQQRNSWNQ